MTDRKQSLIALRDKVKAGHHTQIPPLSPITTDLLSHYDKVVYAYHGSLDAAHDLHKAVLPGWAVDICIYGEAVCTVSKSESRQHHSEESDTPARAWLLAILEALIAEADQ